MERITFIEYGGRNILIEDFSGLRPGDELALVDVSHSTFNAETIGTLKTYTTENEPYVRAAAVVGIEGLLGVALLAVSKFSGRTFGSFPDRPSAMDWLIAQP